MLYNGCNYLSMLGLKLNHVSKRGHWGYGIDGTLHPSGKLWEVITYPCHHLMISCCFIVRKRACTIKKSLTYGVSRSYKPGMLSYDCNNRHSGRLHMKLILSAENMPSCLSTIPTRWICWAIYNFAARILWLELHAQFCNINYICVLILFAVFHILVE